VFYAAIYQQVKPLCLQKEEDKMASKQTQHSKDAKETNVSQSNEQSPGMRSTEVNANPKIALEEARNANEGKAPNAAGSVADSDAENYVPSSAEDESSDLPTAR
jgi:hypothetical protein